MSLEVSQHLNLYWRQKVIKGGDEYRVPWLMQKQIHIF